MMTRRMKYLTFGLLAGGMAGAITALLYAPMKGEKLRSEIKRKSGEVMEDAQEMFEKASHRVAGTLSVVQKKGDRVLKSARKAGNNAAETVSRAINS